MRTQAPAQYWQFFIGIAFIVLVQISGSPHTQEGRGFAIAGLVLSATSLLWSFGFALFSLATNQTQAVFNFGQN